MSNDTNRRTPAAQPAPASTVPNGYAEAMARELLPLVSAARELDVEAERRHSPTIVDADGLPQAVAEVIRSNGDITSLASLYALIDAWGERQRKYAARSAAQSTAPAPAKPWPQVNAEAIAAQDLLEWNRSQGKRPIEVTKELDVARKAFEFLAAAKVITAAQEAYQATPVSTEQAGDAWSELVNAANATVERWHSKDWKQPHTAEFINRLALAIGTVRGLRAPSPNNSPVGADKEPK